MGWGITEGEQSALKDGKIERGKTHDGASESLKEGVVQKVCGWRGGGCEALYVRVS